MMGRELQPGRVLYSPSANTSTNMALDQALFDIFVKEKKTPLIRFYTFNESSITYGYFQDIKPDDYIKRQKSRRITGGGIVLHGKDLIITFIFNPLEFDLKGTDQKDKIYAKLKSSVIDGLIEAGIDPTGFCEYSNYSDDELKKYECFIKIVPHDVIYNDKKLTGFALRRRKGGVMVQSSLRVWKGENDDAISIEEICNTQINLQNIYKALKKGFSNNWGIEFEESTITGDELNLTKRLIPKYNSDNWNFKSENFLEVR
jgi:lipoate-protein ligase A